MVTHEAMPSQGALARALIAADARWMRDSILGAHAVGSKTGSAVSLLLLGTASRIVYEGLRVLREVELDIDVSSLLQHAPEELDSLVARARHATKLLDDTKRSVTAIVRLLEQYHRAQQQAFRGSSRSLRSSLPDLGLILNERHVLGATVPLQLRLGLPVEADLKESGLFLRRVSEEMGSALAVLAAVDLDMEAYSQTPSTLTLPPLRWQDVDAATYLQDRFDPSAPDAPKFAMLMISSELQTCARLLPFTAVDASPAVGRARFVSFMHSLRGVRTLLDGGWLGTDTEAGRQVLAVVSDPQVARFLSERGYRHLRNQYVHYLFRGDQDRLDPSLGDWGLAALLTGTSSEQLDREVSAALTALADATSAWGDQQSVRDPSAAPPSG